MKKSAVYNCGRMHKPRRKVKYRHCSKRCTKVQALLEKVHDVVNKEGTASEAILYHWVGGVVKANKEVMLAAVKQSSFHHTTMMFKGFEVCFWCALRNRVIVTSGSFR